MNQTIPASRLVLRRGLHHRVPSEKETVEGSGYWVEFRRVQLNAMFFWNGHWYTRGLVNQGHGINGLQYVSDDTPVFVRTMDALK